MVRSENVFGWSCKHLVRKNKVLERELFFCVQHSLKVEGKFGSALSSMAPVLTATWFEMCLVSGVVYKIHTIPCVVIWKIHHR